MRRAKNRSRVEATHDIQFAGRAAAVMITGSDHRLKRRVAQQVHGCRNGGAGAFIQVRTAADLTRADDRQQSGASLFLEDVGQLNSREQAALMEWFDRQAVDASAALVPVRVIAGADARLYDWVQRGAFREDLFYRLNMFHIFIPEWRSPRRTFSAGQCAKRPSAASVT